MKRVAEIKQKREHAFWKHRCVHVLQLISYMLAYALGQNGCKPRKAACASQEEAGEGKDICQTCRANSYGILWYREDTGKNQGPDKSTKRPCTWRRSVDGYGYRLGAAVFSLVSVYIFSTFMEQNDQECIYTVLGIHCVANVYSTCATPNAGVVTNVTDAKAVQS